MDEIIAKEAHERRESFIKLHTLSKGFELKLIWEMYKNQDFKSLGFENFNHYCEAPINSGGLGISRSYAVQLYSVYQRFVEDLGVSEKDVMEIGPRKLYSIKDRVDENNVDEILERARSLSQRDLVLETKNINPDTCEHDWQTIKKCRICGRFENNV